MPLFEKLASPVPTLAGRIGRCRRDPRGGPATEAFNGLGRIYSAGRRGAQCLDLGAGGPLMDSTIP
jgi:hypothetical protein